MHTSKQCLLKVGIVLHDQAVFHSENVKIMSPYEIYHNKNESNPTDIFKTKLLKLHAY